MTSGHVLQQPVPLGGSHQWHHLRAGFRNKSDRILQVHSNLQRQKVFGGVGQHLPQNHHLHETAQELTTGDRPHTVVLLSERNQVGAGEELGQLFRTENGHNRFAYEWRDVRVSPTTTPA